MGTALAGGDLRRMNDLLSRVATASTSPDGLPDDLLLGLTELVGCDLATFLDADVASGKEFADQESDGRTVTRVDDDDPRFWELYWTSTFCSYPSRTGDDRSVTLLSDFYGQREWQASPMYVELFHAYDVQHELMCSLPTKGTRVRRVLLNRGRGPDFDDRDRMVMALLRPHLAEMHAQRAAATDAQSLTPRQTELLRLVAAGRSTAQIAELLFLSPGTVRKHVENIFERLGVTSRTAAVMRVFAEELTAEG